MELITTLADQGVIALLLALSLIGNIRMFFIILNEKDKQIKKAEETTQKMLQPVEGLQTTLNGITILLQNLVRNKI